MSTVSIERLYSAPLRVYVDGQETRKQFRSLSRDSSGRLWAVGDGQVLLSPNGMDWSDLSLNLKDEGTFTVDSVILWEENPYLFARNRLGLFTYRLDDQNRNWRPISEIHTSSACVVALAGPDTFTLVAWDRGSTVVHRSQDRGQSWVRVSFGSDEIPVYLQSFGAGRALCCLRGAFKEENPNGQDRSSLYSTIDSGLTWRLVAHLDTMALAGTALEDAQVLIGGTGGFLSVFDFKGCHDIMRPSGDDIVAVDYLSGTSIAVSESEKTSIQHRLIIGEPEVSSTQLPFNLDGRIVGARLIGGRNIVLCTTRELYQCSYS